MSTEVEMVVVPGTEGNFGVLPGHAPLISTIRPGTVDIYEGRIITERIFVVGGIAEVTPEARAYADFQGLEIHEVDAERNLLLVKGSIPGPRKGLVEIHGVDA